MKVVSLHLLWMLIIVQLRIQTILGLKISVGKNENYPI